MLGGKFQWRLSWLRSCWKLLLWEVPFATLGWLRSPIGLPFSMVLLMVDEGKEGPRNQQINQGPLIHIDTIPDWSPNFDNLRRSSRAMSCTPTKWRRALESCESSHEMWNSYETLWNTGTVTFLMQGYSEWRCQECQPRMLLAQAVATILRALRTKST